MKHLFPRLGALTLALLLLLTSAPVLAADSEAYGTLYHHAETALHDGVTYEKNIYWSSYYGDLRQEHYFTYTPGGGAALVVATGASASGRLTGAEAAAALEEQGWRVVAGINGDYFESAGTPIGLLVTEGRLLSSDGSLPAVGFTADGGAVIGRPGLVMTVTGAGGTMYLAGLNKVRSSGGGIYAYTHDFNDKHTTGTVESGIEVVLEPVGGHDGPAIGQSVAYRVASTAQRSGTPVAEGQLVLSINSAAASNHLDLVRALAAGDEVTLTVTAGDSAWNDVEWAIGGLHMLVENGQALTNSEAGNNPRTAVGIREDGTVVLYTVDGRKSGYSIGASLTTLGQRMAELGCVSALCLDGGGSTTALASLPDSTAAQGLNRPSDGSQRKVTNFLMLVADGEATGRLGGVYLQDPGPYILTGASAALAANRVDTAYFPMEGSVDLSASAGEVEDGVFTAPERAGSVTLTASYRNFSAQRTITAVSEPQSISLSANGAAISSLTLKPGDQVQLTASALYNKLAVLCGNTDFTWSVSDGLGTVDENGLLTVSRTPGTGSLTVSRGSASLTIPVTITTLPLVTQEDFEGDVSRYYGYGVTLAQETVGDYVRYGRASLEVAYTQDGSGAALYTGWDIPAGYDQILLSVYGDGSGNTVSLYDDQGNTTPAFTLDFTGWRQVTLSIPAGAEKLNALIISGSTAGGTIWLDQAVSTYGGLADTAAPVISGSVSGGILTATVSDAIDGAPAREDLTLTVDGQALDFQYSGGTLTAALPAAGGTDRRVTLTARDHSGNLARQSWDLTGDGSGRGAFTDLVVDGADHWAAPYVQYLYGRGVLTGYEENGVLLAKPDKALTRAEFAVMLYRWLGLEDADYEHVQLPFQDAASIQDWVLPAARAMYALGIIQGSGDGSGGVTFDGGSTLTRAQAVTMLGRIQEKGYPSGSLESFADGAEVPAWAGSYLETMVAQGILNGIDGSLYPNRTMTRGQAAKVLWAMG